MADLGRALGLEDLDPELLERAVTHRSWAFEHPPDADNERLEFLGDAVLGLIVARELYRLLPEAREGELSPQRSAAVRESSLASVARGLGLGPHLRLGRGEAGSGGADKDSILSDALEAVIAAVHLTRGYDATEALVLDWFRRHAGPLGLDGAAVDAKTRLQERLAAIGLPAPDYATTHEGPDHDRTFTAEVRVDGRPRGTGVGRSKKAAEQEAAAEALAALGPDRDG